MPAAIRTLCLLAIGAFLLSAQKYNGPRPPKPDVPFLLHASTLIETESAEATEEKRKDDTIYWIAGASSPVRTPLAEPIFLLLAEKLQPEKMELYRLDVKGGRRQILFPKRQRDAPRPLHLTATRLDQGLYRLEANQPLENGEYSLTPAGSNQVFLFQVY